MVRATRFISAGKHAARWGCVLIAAAITATVCAAQPLQPVRLNVVVQQRAAGTFDSLPTDDELRDITVDPWVRSRMEQLADPSYSVREQAMDDLLNARIDVRQFCVLLGEPGFTVEQRYRLLEVLRHQLLNAPRGALGIRMPDPTVDTLKAGGVEVTVLLPGLPAEKMLVVGDFITHIDGQLLRSTRDLIDTVQLRRPGDEVAIDLRRPRRDERGELITNADGEEQYETLQVTLLLGSVQDLHDPVAGGPAAVASVVQSRRMRASEAVRRYAPQPVLVRMVPSPPAPSPSSPAVPPRP